MLVDLNGMGFHLNIQDGGTLPWRAFVVDEAFTQDPMSSDIIGAECVIALLERYSGICPDDDVCSRIALLFPMLAVAA